MTRVHTPLFGQSAATPAVKFGLGQSKMESLKLKCNNFDDILPGKFHPQVRKKKRGQQSSWCRIIFLHSRTVTVSDKLLVYTSAETDKA